jgi:hypothetical protein
MKSTEVMTSSNTDHNDGLMHSQVQHACIHEHNIAQLSLQRFTHPHEDHVAYRSDVIGVDELL